ncbi:MAG: HEAT repeat domain-containing protein [Actinomycetota bacterium]|nr:HEAT repeat domain-containing protein [Actinomycetota bacterium]
MDAVVVPLVVIQVVAISLVVLDLLLLTFVVVYRITEGALNARRVPQLAAARKSMLTAIAGVHPLLGEETPQLKGSASMRLSMLAAAQLLNTIKGEAQVELVRHLLMAEYDTRAIELLGSRKGLDRGVACELLGALGHSAYAGELTRLVEDSDPDVRNTAVRALGRLRNPSAIDCLLSSLEHSDGAPPALVGAALLRIGPVGAPALRRGLRSDNANTRALCAKVLGLLDDFMASSDLVALLLEDQSRLPLVEAARALGRIGGQSARASDALHNDTYRRRSANRSHRCAVCDCR